MSDFELKEMQEKLLELMQVVHNVCVEQHINYYIIAGTLLGAVRHKGFIPWDDDIDIAIPRDDYERLINLPREVWPENIVVNSPNKDDDFIFTFSKIVNKNTTLIESRGVDIKTGIYIDVFPLDGVSSIKLFHNTRLLIFHFFLGLLNNSQENIERKSMARKIFNRFAQKLNSYKIFKFADYIMRGHSYNNSKYVANFSSGWITSEILDKSIYGDPILYKFEDIEVYGPENYELYLKNLYGDYRELPPKDKRKSHHNFVYIDLNKPYKYYHYDDNKK